jgi:hypothetical protein
LETLSTVALTQPLTFISNNAGSFATLPPTSSKFFSSKIDFSFSYKPVVQNSTSIGVSTGLGGAVYAAFAQLVSFVGSAGSPVIISNNNANYGGGLYAKTSNSLVINNANISSNAGSIYFLFEYLAVIFVSSLMFWFFSAPLGGGGVVASQTPITMSSIVFAANSASTGSGGALLVDSQYLNPTLFAANGVTFTQNVAQFSPSFVSSPSSLSITYGNNSVTSIPGASSGPAFPIPLTATLLDSNGNVVQTESIAQVNMIVSAGGSISGTGSQTLVRGVTVFSTAGVVGTPGTTLTIAFQVTPISTGITLTSAPISVYLRLCRVGEAISASVCTVCTNSLYSLTLPAPQVCPMKCPPFSETNIDGSACVCSFGSQKGLLVRAEDGDLICVERMQLWEQGVLWALSAIMMVITLVMLVMVMYWRKKRTLHSSSPLFCAIVIFGGTLAAASMADSVVIRTPDNCFYAYWLLHLGFTTTFGALFTKTYRLSVIFNNAELRAVSIANSQLLVALGVLIAVDVGILSAWSFSGSFEVYPWSQVSFFSFSCCVMMEVFMFFIVSDSMFESSHRLLSRRADCLQSSDDMYNRFLFFIFHTSILLTVFGCVVSVRLTLDVESAKRSDIVQRISSLGCDDLQHGPVVVGVFDHQLLTGYRSERHQQLAIRMGHQMCDYCHHAVGDFRSQIPCDHLS